MALLWQFILFFIEFIVKYLNINFKELKIHNRVGKNIDYANKGHI